jgi:DNA-binding CsgD family transcriptional regulator
LGEPLEQNELAKLADAAVLEALERRGLIASRVDGRRIELRLGHPVYGDVIRVGISPLRERNLARSLAEVIEVRSRPDSLLLASLRLIGGGGSPELLVAGSIAARARHDHSLAERLARAAIDDGAGFAARYVAAEAAHLQGRPEQAERELAALSSAAASNAEQAQVALLRFDNAFFLRGRDADLRLIDDAAEAVTDPLWRDELRTRRLLAMGASSGPRAVVEAASTLLRRTSPGPLTAAHLPVSISLVRLGRIEDASNLLSPDPGGAVTPAPDEPWEQWNLFGHRAAGLVYAGRLREAEELLARAYNLVIDQPAALPRASVARWLSILHLEQGRPVSAFRRASESYTLFQQLGHTYAARSPYGLAAHALSLAGRAERATGTLAALDALNLPMTLHYEADIRQARAWTAAAAGHLSAARDRLESAADFAEQIGDLIGATNALHGLARLGRAGQVATRLTALASEIDGDLATVRAAYANAVADGDSAALDQVSGDFARFGANLYAAEAHAESAVILRRTGQARAAAAAEHKAARLLTRCEGATTPPLASVTARVNLTPGELDAAVQAATGRTNKQIASDMHLSVRTVESHLQRVYEKLGVSGRHELADALQDQPSV